MSRETKTNHSNKSLGEKKRERSNSSNKVFARNVLDWAKEEGLNLIPIHYKQKKPSIKWKTYQKKLSTDKQRAAWFLSDEKTNYAVICGKISNNLFVVDVDNNQLAEILKNKFPDTTVVRPSKGLHFYFFSKTPLKKRRLEFLDQKETVIGVDIQAEGSYVLCPPSIHPSGKAYQLYSYIKIPTVDYENILETIHTIATTLELEFILKKKDYARVTTTAKIQKMIDLLPSLEEMIGFEGSGPHPIHGSEGRTNLRVDSENQQWYYFRHGVGGSKIQWYAIHEGIIDCADAASMTKEDYRKVFEKISGGTNKKEEEKGEIPEGKEWLRYFKKAIEKEMLDPERVSWRKDKETDELLWFNLAYVLEEATNVREALAICRRTNEVSGICPKGINQNQMLQITTQVIISALLNNGFFIEDQHQFYYYFNEQALRVFSLSYDGKKPEPEFEAHIYEQYLPSKIAEVCKNIIYYAIEHHQKREMHILFYYDKEEEVLYVFNRENEYYRLDGETVTKHPNGKHVLFRPETLEKITYLSVEKRGNPYKEVKEIPGIVCETDDLLLNILVNRINFSDDYYLNANEQRLQLAMQIYAFAFRTYIKTKPIMTWVGERGSLKTASNTHLGMFLLDSKYAIHTSPRKREDFIAAIINNPYYFLDNLKGEARWFAGDLAAIASGGLISIRKLYLTGKEAKFIPSNFLSINSINPVCQSPDVVDRMLIFHTTIPEKYLGDNDIREPLLKYRNELWSFYIDNLNAIVKTLKKRKRKEFQQTIHRLADWAIFGKVVNKTLQLDKKYKIKIKQFYHNLDNAKAAFPLENNPLLPALKIFINEHENQWKTAKEITERLNSYETEWEGNVQGIAQQFRTLKRNFNNLYGFHTRNNSKTRKKEYCFGHNPSETRKKLTQEEFWIVEGRITEIIDSLIEEEEEERVSITEVIEKAVSKGISKNQVVKSIDELLKNGEYFEPQTGFLKRP